MFSIDCLHLRPWLLCQILLAKTEVQMSLTDLLNSFDLLVPSMSNSEAYLSA